MAKVTSYLVRGSPACSAISDHSVAEPCGSKSTTRAVCPARPAAYIAVVVFAAPPFVVAIAIIIMNPSSIYTNIWLTI